MSERWCKGWGMNHNPFTGAVLWKILCLVLISVEHRIKIDRRSLFSVSITCLVLHLLTVLEHAISLWCYLLTNILNTSHILQSMKYYSNQPAEFIQTLHEYSKVVQKHIRGNIRWILPSFLWDILYFVNLISNAWVDDITNELYFAILKDEYLENKTRYQETKRVLTVFLQIIFDWD